MSDRATKRGQLFAFIHTFHKTLISCVFYIPKRTMTHTRAHKRTKLFQTRKKDNTRDKLEGLSLKTFCCKARPELFCVLFLFCNRCHSQVIDETSMQSRPNFCWLNSVPQKGGNLSPCPSLCRVFLCIFCHPCTDKINYVKCARATYDHRKDNTFIPCLASELNKAGQSHSLIDRSHDLSWISRQSFKTV